MSDQLARGWDQPSESTGREPVLCGYHLQVTEHLSAFHAEQIARQCPQCVSTSRDATNSLV